MSDYTKKWTPEAVEFLHTWYGLMPAREMATRLSNLFNRTFTATAVHVKAGEEGLDARDAQGYLTISEAARQLGKNPKYLAVHIRRQGIKTLGRGWSKYLPEESFRQLAAYFAAPKEATVSTREAARQLHFHHTTITQQVREGRLDGYMVGGRLRIPVREVNRVLALRRGAENLGARQEVVINGEAAVS